MKINYDFTEFNDIYLIHDNTDERIVSFYDSDFQLIQELSTGVIPVNSFLQAETHDIACLPIDQYNGGNMCHVTFDHVVRAIEFSEQYNTDNVKTFFYDTSWPWARFFISKTIRDHCFLEKRKVYRFKTAFIMQNGFSDHFFHPNLVHSEISRNKLLQAVKDNVSETSNRIQVYLTRKGRGSRAIKNESLMEDFFSSKGFLIYEVTDNDILEQLSIFCHADTVVALHGAGLANLIACRKNTKVVEIFSGKGTRAYEELSRSLDLNYHRFEIEADNDSNIELSELQRLEREVKILNKSDGDEFLKLVQSYTNKISKINSSIKNVISEDEIDSIKNAALFLEDNRVDMSLKLMKFAGRFRPKGPLIVRKIKEYSDKQDNKGDYL